MYLLDTNILMEVLLNRKNAASATQFLRSMPGSSFYVTDFALFSLGIYLFKGTRQAYFDLLDDMTHAKVGILRLLFDDNATIAQFKIAETYRLDFDDAYQFVAATREQLTIVSYDSDFDRTPIGRVTPEQVLSGYST